MTLTNSRRPAVAKVLCWFLAAVVIFSVIALLVVRAFNLGSTGNLILTASTGFVLLAVAGGGFASWYGRAITLGLVGCWFGDILGSHNFVAGVLAFLLAHLTFMAAFWTRGVAWRRLVTAVPPMLVISSAMLLWLLPHVPANERPIVLAYVFVISAMVIFASGASSGLTGRIALIGAVIFYISDIFVARWRYAGGGPENGTYCYPLYYTACVLLALSIYAETYGMRRQDA